MTHATIDQDRRLDAWTHGHPLPASPRRRQRPGSCQRRTGAVAFDRIDRIGGHPTTVVGNPRVVETPIGRAVEFDGVDDALFVDAHPLAGAKTFTWEAMFRPDGGEREQRWFHLQENGTENRMLFEIRVMGDRWFLDSFTFSATGNATLMNKNSL